MSILNEEKAQPEKLKVDIYVPLNVCTCQWEQFINLVFNTLTKYTRFINFETKNLDSEEARKLNLHENCVVVDDKRIFTTSNDLKQKLPEILKEKGLT
ncbi:MAG TPA: hypothetical protein VGB37_02365 [Candidatus Lokiarchaeia archaeon]